MGYRHNIGIKAIEIYFPNQYVDQNDLEKYDGVSQGKYTIGLGQAKMSICDDREDPCSFALTTVSSLMRKYGIDPRSIGRLEVGTETIIDKCKSVKSVLMQLFETSNTNIEGVDTYNACYGGTNALFNAINWVESSAWDGRDAIVVATDIATYNTDRAKPTGGAGCIAMLVGPDAPLIFEPGLRGTYMRHTYDFYKPDPSMEYPYLDGALSLQCYGEALDGSYEAYLAREKTLHARANGTGATNGTSSVNGMNGVSGADGTADNTAISTANGGTADSHPLPADRFDYMCFHSPTCKTVMKSWARLYYNDFLADPDNELFRGIPVELRVRRNFTEAALSKQFVPLTKKRFAQRVQPSCQIPSQCGNMYTASLYSALCGLLSSVGSEELLGKRVGLFSYGSGLASSMFSLRVVGSTEGLRARLDLQRRLDARKLVTPESYDEMRKLRELLYGQKSYKPIGSTDNIAEGTYYLVEIDALYRRIYAVKE